MSQTPTRTPKQERSKRTVEFILEATTQILLEDGYDAVSTNKIAKRAGVSIGTLYQYFSNKEQIIEAVAQRYFDQLGEKVMNLIASASLSDGRAAVGAVVRASIDIFGEDPNQVGQFFNQFDRTILAIADKAHERMENVLMGVLIGEGYPASDAFMRARIIVRAFTGTVRATLRREPMLIRDPSFVNALEELVSSYLFGEGDSRT